jgi:hypothetical protein
VERFSGAEARRFFYGIFGTTEVTTISLTQKAAEPNPKPATSSRFPESVVADALCRKKPKFRMQVRFVALGYLWRWDRMRRIWVSAFRSFRSHIQILIAKEPKLGDLGSGYQYDADGHLQLNTRTEARSLYIEKWSSVSPWSDSVDLETFLMGFDAGEQWASGRQDWDTPIDNTTDRQGAWLTSFDGEEIRDAVRTEMIRQAAKTEGGL